MKRDILATLALLLALALASGCAGVRQEEVAASQRFSEQVRWPAEYEPEEASFFVHNEIEIAASPEDVWSVLIEAEGWPEWYEGASEVDVLDDPEGILREGSVFTWVTMGLFFESTIKEFEPYSRLAWESDKWSIQGYHAWLIVPTEEGCILITDESQKGFLTFFEKVFQPNKLRRLHDVWLAKIKERAEERAKARLARR